MDEKVEAINPQKKRFKRFNDGLAYGLDNIFRFVWTITKFCVKVSGVSLFLFPFVIMAMCIISPESATATLEALMRFIQNVINIFK